MKIKSYIPINGKLKVVEIFGRRNRGVPGLHFLGVGNFSQHLSEKFFYITKDLGYRVPLGKYTLCVEFSEEVYDLRKSIDWRWLELPLFILFWSLSEILLIKNLQYCFVTGKISINKSITQLYIKDLASLQIQSPYIMMGVGSIQGVPSINLEELLYRKFKIKTFKWIEF